MIQSSLPESLRNSFRTLPLLGVFLTFCWLGAGSAGAQEPGSQMLGDADGNGALNQADVAFVQAAIDAEAAQTEPYALTDVAYPCDGYVDGADLALIDRAVRSGPREAPVDSVCHGSPLGSPQPQPQPPPSGDPQTLDEVFWEIASEVPEFGGLYFDANGAATIVLTKEDEQVVSAASEAVFQRFDPERLGTETLRVVPGDYGFAELHGWRMEARDVFTLPGVVATDTHEVANRFWIGLESWDDREVVELYLQNIGVPLTLVQFEEIGLDSETQATGFNDQMRPIMGGIAVQNCTIGTVLNMLGQRGFLLNSHCTATSGVLDGSNFFQPGGLSGDFVGMEIFDPPLFTSAQNSVCPSGKQCRFSDAAFVRTQFSATSVRGRVRRSSGAGMHGFRWITNVEMNPLCGDPVTKSGKTTGAQTGEITQTCTDRNIGFMKLCQLKASMPSDNGDSGGPVYQDGPISVTSFDDSATFVGLNWGQTGTGKSLISPMAGLVTDLGSFDPTSGNDPPFVTITSPLNGDTIGTGSSYPIVLSATVNDLESGFACEGCLVDWKSTLDGYLGTTTVSGGVTSLSTELFGPGTRKITATAHDYGNAEGIDAVTVHTGNSAASIWIDQPANSTQIPLGVGVTFSGSSADPEMMGAPLGCNAVVWLPKGPGDQGAFGCSAVLTFNSLGWRQVEFRGIDPYGEISSATIWVQVVPLPTTGPPLITLLAPEVNPLLARDQFQQVSGYATDPDGKSPLTFQWVLKGPNLIGGTNGEVTLATTTANNGETTSFSFVPSSYVSEVCGGVVLDLEVRVTDADNQQSVMTRQVTVAGPLC